MKFDRGNKMKISHILGDIHRTFVDTVNEFHKCTLLNPQMQFAVLTNMLFENIPLKFFIILHPTWTVVR